MKVSNRIAIPIVMLFSIIQSGCPQFGCRKILCSNGPSNLWPRYVQRLSDRELEQRCFCPNPTHLTKVTSDYEMGFTNGYYDTAMCRIQPYPQYGYLPVHWPTQTQRRISNNAGNPFYQQGVADGVAVASYSTIGGFAPGQGPLEPVPLTLPPKQPKNKPVAP